MTTLCSPAVMPLSTRRRYSTWQRNVLGLAKSHLRLVCSTSIGLWKPGITDLLKPGRELMTRTRKLAVAMIVVALGIIVLAVGGARSDVPPEIRVPRHRLRLNPRAPPRADKDVKPLAELPKALRFAAAAWMMTKNLW